jgi:hypothetical protein
MKLFMGIVLWFSTAVGEAIPEPFSALDSVQQLFYKAAVRATKNLQAPDPLYKNDSSPDVIPPSASASDVGAVMQTISPVPETTVTSVPDSSRANTGSAASVPGVAPTPIVPKPSAHDPIKPPVVSVSAVATPSRKKVLSQEEVRAQLRAKELYSKEAGYVGVTDRVVTSKDGQRFLYINIKGDGDCGFYASGVSRSTFVTTIQDLINDQHEDYQAFFTNREGLHDEVKNCMLSGDMADMAERLRRLADRADNGNSIIDALKLVTDFGIEKKKYQAELFQDARNSLIKSLQNLEKAVAIKANSSLMDQIQSLIGQLASASHDDVAIHTMIKTDAEKILTSITSHKSLHSAANASLSDLLHVSNLRDEQLFEKSKARLMNKIQNLTTLASYEAFLTALRQELIASHLPEADLVSKEEILAGVEKIFSINRGSVAWFPGGIFGALIDRLRIKYNIWRRVNGDIISLYSSSGDSRGSAEKGDNVRDMFFTGGHYDMLIPINAIGVSN